MDVSVIVPSFNRANMIRAAVESCRSCDSVLSVEVILVDDGSTDNTAEIAPSLGVKYIRFPENRGRFAARNEGIQQSVGDYVKFLDSDDRLEPDSLAAEVAAAKCASAEIVISGWREHSFSKEGVWRETGRYHAPNFQNIIDDLLAGKGVPTGSALYKREHISGQRWIPHNRYDDWDFFIHAALRASRVVTCAVYSYQWRHHNGPRVTHDPRIEQIRAFYEVLHRLRYALESRGEFNAARMRRYAQYLYKELRSLYRIAPAEARLVLREIRSLDSNFRPMDEERSIAVRVLGRIIPISVLMESIALASRLLDSRTSRRSQSTRNAGE